MLLGNYGPIKLKRTATMFSSKIRRDLGKLSKSRYPLSFEALNQNFGYVLYETRVPTNSLNKPQSVLEVIKIRDLAHVYSGGKYVGNLSREESKTKLHIEIESEVLSIMVENLGRINFGSGINDKKGILSIVSLDDVRLLFWKMTGFELKDLKAVEDCFDKYEEECDNDQGFVFYVQKFKLPNNTGSVPLDSYLDMSHLSKGLVFVNGFNLGRYWSSRGPQYSLYVPGVYLKPYPEENTIIALEENIATNYIYVNFTTTPILS